MAWLVVNTQHSTHMVPMNDVQDHTTVTACWCRPKFDDESNLNYPNFIHNNFYPDEEGHGEEPDDGKYN